MTMERWDLADCSHRLVAFREARDWAQFHTPKNLSAALSIEVGELQETMLWKRDEEIASLLGEPEFRARFEEEIADIGICLLMLAERTGVDLRHAIMAKIDSNERRYTIEDHHGVATKAPK